MILAETELRHYRRHLVNLDAFIQTKHEKYSCRIIDIGQGGLKTHIPLLDSSLANKLSISLDNHIVQADLAWIDGSFVGIKYSNNHNDCDQLLTIEPKSDAFTPSIISKLISFFKTDYMKVTEIFLACCGLIFIMVQTYQINKQSELQTILTVEDSERFINRLMVESPELRNILIPPKQLVEGEDISPKDRQFALVATFLFLQEWEKMYRMKMEGIIEDDYWFNYIKIIKNVSGSEPFKTILSEENTLIGFNDEYIKFLHSDIGITKNKKAKRN